MRKERQAQDLKIPVAEEKRLWIQGAELPSSLDGRLERVTPAAKVLTQIAGQIAHFGQARPYARAAEEILGDSECIDATSCSSLGLTAKEYFFVQACHARESSETPVDPGSRDSTSSCS